MIDVMVEQKGVFKKPLSLSMEEAAGIPLTFGLAVRGLFGCCNIKNNQSILIHSRDSTGLAAVQVRIAGERARRDEQEERWERENTF